MISAARPIILRLHADGLGPTSIARHLNATGVPTPSGRGRWWPETVVRHRDPATWAAYMRAYRARMRR